MTGCRGVAFRLHTNARRRCRGIPRPVGDGDGGAVRHELHVQRLAAHEEDRELPTERVMAQPLEVRAVRALAHGAVPIYTYLQGILAVF